MIALVALEIGLTMSSTAQSIETVSEQEYLDGEKISEVKHEYIDGCIYAMAGASRRHVIISGNLFASLRSGAKGSRCVTFQSDMKVRVVGKKSYFYPDVVVDCGEVTDDYYLETPCLIVEVLSKSTAKRDRSEKLLSYMNIPTLKAYLLVEQDQPEVELFYRQENGEWWVESLEGLGAALTLPCPDMELTLDDIYEDISF